MEINEIKKQKHGNTAIGVKRKPSSDGNKSVKKTKNE